jgi:hypothetical protein
MISQKKALSSETGVTGASTLLRLNGDFLRMFTFDWLHTLALGVCKSFLEETYKPELKGEPYVYEWSHLITLSQYRTVLEQRWYEYSGSISRPKKEAILSEDQKTALDQMLHKIQSPTDIGWKPKNLSAVLNSLTGTLHVTAQLTIQGSELKNLILYYCPFLFGASSVQLPKPIQDLWIAMFVISISLSNILHRYNLTRRKCTVQEISVNEIKDLQPLVIKVNRLTEQHLGLKGCKSNTHKLVHLPLYIADHGPLTCYWLFAFERFNQLLRSLIHGTKDADKQVALQNQLLRLHTIWKLETPELFYSGKELDDLQDCYSKP